jgi:hypothetical protein
MYFNNIITCADWKVEEAQNVIDSQFRKKIVFFEQFGITPPRISITHYSVNSWKVIVSTNYINKDGIIILYNDIIPKDHEGIWDRVKAKQNKSTR